MTSAGIQFSVNTNSEFATASAKTKTFGFLLPQIIEYVATF